MNILEGIPTEKLSREAEDNLARDGSASALEQLVLHSLREGYIYLKGCCSRNLSDGEVLSAAYTGLEAAARLFEPDRIRFFAYAKPFCRGAASKARRAQGVFPSLHAKSGDWAEFKPLYDDTTDYEEEGHWCSYEGNDVGILCTNVDIPRPISASVVLPSEEPKLEQIYIKEEWERIEPTVRAALNDREKMVLSLCFHGGLSPKEIADLLKCTRSNVSRIRQLALLKVRNALMEVGLWTS